MVSTPELIKLLVADAKPVRPLRPPLIRTAAWLGFAAVVILLIALAFGIRPDLPAKFREPRFLLEWSAALMTGVTAATAAFHVSLPDRRGLWLLAPLPFLVVWLAFVGYGCLTDWVGLEPTSITVASTLRCFLTALLTSLPLSLWLFPALRRAGGIRPRITSLLAALAVAALTASGLRLFHDLDASVLVLVWNLGVAVLISGCAAALGGTFLKERRVV